MIHYTKKGLLLLLVCLLYAFSGYAQNNIEGYQYWFDNDYANQVQATVSPVKQLTLNEAISLETIDDGLHIFTIRFKDSNGFWSIPVSQFFFSTNLTDNKIVNYQYWFDNDFISSQLISVTPEKQIHFTSQLSLESISTGMHLFTIRFKDSKNKWSVPVSQFIYKSSSIVDNRVTGYRYWINDSIEKATYVAVNNPSELLILNEEINFPGLSNGEYTIHFQFKDASGQWSLVTSDNFTLSDLTAIDNTFKNEIKAYPNPSNGIVHINMGSSFKSVGIEVYNYLGEKINHYFYENEQSLKIDLNNHPTGIYYIKISANNNHATFQLVKN